MHNWRPIEQQIRCLLAPGSALYSVRAMETDHRSRGVPAVETDHRSSNLDKGVPAVETDYRSSDMDRGVPAVETVYRSSDLDERRSGSGNWLQV